MSREACEIEIRTKWRQGGGGAPEGDGAQILPVAGKRRCSKSRKFASLKFPSVRKRDATSCFRESRGFAARTSSRAQNRGGARNAIPPRGNA